MPEIGFGLSKLKNVTLPKVPQMGNKFPQIAFRLCVLTSVGFCRGHPPIAPGNRRQLSPKAAAPFFSTAFYFIHLLCRLGLHDVAMELPAKLLELVKDPEVRDIVISGDFCAIDRGRGLEEATSPFTEVELEGELRQLAFEAGVRCDISKPVADIAIGRFRIHAVLPYGISTAPQLSLRVHPENHLGLRELTERGGLCERWAAWLISALNDQKTIVFSGATGCGKTTLMRALLMETSERVISIEQTPELRLVPPAVQLYSREANQEGVGEVTLSELVTHSLRMRPDRLVIGEVRSSEFGALLQAISNGHPGSMTTLHATSLAQVADRLLILGKLSGLSGELTSMLVTNSIDYVVQLSRESRELEVGIPRLNGSTLEIVRLP
jgi:pilus assembly protein CpaF